MRKPLVALLLGLGLFALAPAAEALQPPFQRGARGVQSGGSRGSARPSTSRPAPRPASRPSSGGSVRSSGNTRSTGSFSSRPSVRPSTTTVRPSSRPTTTTTSRPTTTYGGTRGNTGATRGNTGSPGGNTGTTGRRPTSVPGARPTSSPSSGAGGLQPLGGRSVGGAGTASTGNTPVDLGRSTTRTRVRFPAPYRPAGSSNGSSSSRPTSSSSGGRSGDATRAGGGRDTKLVDRYGSANRRGTQPRTNTSGAAGSKTGARPSSPSTGSRPGNSSSGTRGGTRGTRGGKAAGAPAAGERPTASLGGRVDYGRGPVRRLKAPRESSTRSGTPSTARPTTKGSGNGGTTPPRGGGKASGTRGNPRPTSAETLTEDAPRTATPRVETTPTKGLGSRGDSSSKALEPVFAPGPGGRNVRTTGLDAPTEESFKTLDGLHGLGTRDPDAAKGVSVTGGALGYAQDQVLSFGVGAVGGIYAGSYYGWGGSTTYYGGYGYGSYYGYCYPYGFGYWNGGVSLYFGARWSRPASWWWPCYYAAWRPIYYACYQPYYSSFPGLYSTVVYQNYYEDEEYVEEPVYIDENEPVGEAVVPVAAEEEQSSLSRAAMRYLELGDRAFREGRYADAVQFYAKAVEFAPGEGSLYLVLADALFAAGDYHYAAYAVRKGLDLDPTLVDALVDKHDFYADPWAFDHQLELLEEYLSDHPSDRDARLVLALNQLFGGRAEEVPTLLGSGAALPDDVAAGLVLEAALRALESVEPPLEEEDAD